MKTFHLYLLTILCQLIVPPLIFASKPGTTALNFLKIEVGAKASGMGGAFSAVADDASAVYWNPAGLAGLRHKQISVMHLSWLEGVNYQFLSYAQPTRRSGTVSASIYYLSNNDIAAYDNTGAKLDKSLQASDLAFALSYARKIAGIDAGISAKFIQENLADESAGALAADLGFLYGIKFRNLSSQWIGQELKIALSAQNIGTQAKFIAKEDPLPMNIRIGAAQKFFYDSLTVSCDVNLPGDDDSYVNSGIDYKIADWVSLRLGYKLKSNKSAYDIQPGLMGGFGIGNDYITLDYAFVPYSVLGGTHRLGLNCRFGRAYDKDIVETKIEKHLKSGKRHFQNKDYIGAYNEFSFVLVVDPTNEQAKEYVAQLQSKIGEIKVEKYLRLAKSYWAEDKLLEAKELLDSVLSLMPENGEAKALLGDVQNALKQEKESRADSMFNQGLEFYKQRQYNDALILWEKVLIVSPEHNKAKEYISKAKEDLVKLDEKNKNEQLEANRKKAEAVFTKGLRFYNEKRWEKAKQAFEEVNKINPEHKEIQRYLDETNNFIAEDYYRKGIKLYAEKNLPNAIKTLEQAVKLNPRKQEINEALSKARAELKDLNSAKAEEYNRNGLKEYGLGNVKTAVELWEKALAADPDNLKIKNSLNRAKEELGKKK